jgi:hypothetical protein
LNVPAVVREVVEGEAVLVADVEVGDVPVVEGEQQVVVECVARPVGERDVAAALGLNARTEKRAVEGAGIHEAEHLLLGVPVVEDLRRVFAADELGHRNPVLQLASERERVLEAESLHEHLHPETRLAELTDRPAALHYRQLEKHSRSVEQIINRIRVSEVGDGRG